MQSAYQMALQVQDASNINGVANDLPKLMELVRGTLRAEMGERYGTDAVARHPAVRLYISKLTEMAGLGFADMNVYHEAYQACKFEVDADKRVKAAQDEADATGQDVDVMLPDGFPFTVTPSEV
jgi:hypothetical protein